MAGGIAGAVLLFALPASAFRSIVPGCIALGIVLVVAQPVAARWLARRSGGARREGHGLAATGGLFLTGVYGGYFGAGQGLLIIAVLGFAVADTLHRFTALRTVLAGATNAVAAVVFVLATRIAWPVVALLAAGAIVGGWAGVHLGRRIPASAYRAIIAAIGVAALLRLTT